MATLLSTRLLVYELPEQVMAMEPPPKLPLLTVTHLVCELPEQAIESGAAAGKRFGPRAAQRAASALS